jgi:L-ornithine N5-oxygenase
MNDQRSNEPTYDLVGIGFGPSNLALAATIREQAETDSVPAPSCLFLESKQRFDWHPNMLMKGTRIQLSFLKDLVTLRNPRSRFSFLVYLQEKDRLVDFINLRQFFPTRPEFNDYYQWVADQVADMVSYQSRVTSIEPAAVAADGSVELLRVTYQELAGGTLRSCLARNLVFATGGRPMIPAGVATTGDGRVFHCRSFLERIQAHYPDDKAAYNFVVVGSGQSAAEIFQYLYEHYPNADVTAALRRYAYQPADESHFVNTIFHPEMTDFLYNLPEADRKRLIDEHYDTNYSAVDLDLIREIYSELYDRKITGETNVRVRSLLELRSIERLDGHRVRAHFFNRVHQAKEAIEADAVILATGFERNGTPPLLSNITSYLREDDSACLEVDRRYRVQSDDRFLPKIFLQGFCEKTHGLSDTLLSVLPIRAQEILDALREETLKSPSPSPTPDLGGPVTEPAMALAGESHG